MSIKYECYFCHSVFAAEDRVEGCEQGYRTGFLCPHCGRNVKDNILLSKQRLDGCQKKWLIRIFWLAVPYFLANLFDRQFLIQGHEVALSTLLFFGFLVGAGAVLVWVPCTRRPGVFMTEPVESPRE
jgi:hypothetical protein